MTLSSFRQGVLWVGLVGTLCFVLVGLWTLVSRVWALSFTQTLEVLVAAPFLALWVLLPLLWAAWPRPDSEVPREDAAVAAVSATVVVGIAAYGYVPEFVVLPLVFGVDPQLESLTVVLWVPGWQWGVLAVAATVRRRRARGRTDGVV